MRKVFLDFDARHEPKTKRFCVKCQKDIKPGSAARVVRVLGLDVLHPADANGLGTEFLVGIVCAKK